MKRLQAFKFEIRPNGEQVRLIRRTAGSCRYVYNKALALQKQNYESGDKYISYNGMTARLPLWKKEGGTKWLTEPPAQTLQQSLKNLEQAFKNFFAKRAGYPKFKKKSIGDSFRFPDAKQFEIDQANSRLFLPKLGWIRYRNSRNILGEAKNITVLEKAGKWFASIQTEQEVETPRTSATASVGGDAGINRFLTLSDGTVYEPLNIFKKFQLKLAKAQKAMSKKVKFSRNWCKAKCKVQQIYSDIANARKDYLHKISTAISKNHALVIVEDLQIKNMSKSSKGSSEKPGKKVKQKSGLNKAILDQGWGMLFEFLGYKPEWNGGWLVKVPPHNTSRTCPCCGHISKDNRVTQAKFLCVLCGYEDNADLVAAINIKRAGHARLACGEIVLSSYSMSHRDFLRSSRNPSK